MWMQKLLALDSPNTRGAFFTKKEINTCEKGKYGMRRRNTVFCILFCLCFILPPLFLSLDSALWLYLGYLGCLASSLFLVSRTFQERETFEPICPFPELSRLDEEQIGEMYCLFLESFPQGVFQDVLDQDCMNNMLNTAHKKLNAYFDKEHVTRISRNQFVVMKEFGGESAYSYEERTAHLDRISNYISLMLSSLITPANKVALRVAPLTLGAAFSGIRYQARCKDDLIELAHFTMKIAQMEKRRYLVSDEHIRARKLNNEECMQGFMKKDWETEITPFFQPIIDSETYRVIGMESLARWQLGGARILDAKIFKDLAYEIGFIERIDMIMIEKTFEALEKLHQDGLVQSNFRIVINISASTLQSLSAQNLVAMAMDYGIHTEDIELDIHDEILVNPWLNRNLQEFKKRSVRVALDLFDRQAFDLESFFFHKYDTIKLDYSRDTDVGQIVPVYDTPLYPSLISIASDNNVDILAKGIENQTQMVAAKKHSVKYLQGNYFTPPIPFLALQIFVKKYQQGLYLEQYEWNSSNAKKAFYG